MKRIKEYTGVTAVRSIAQLSKVIVVAFVFQLVAALIFVSSASAQTTSIVEFDAMPTGEKSQIIRSALGVIYNHYSVTKPDAEKAGCMLELFNDPDRIDPNSEKIDGYDHFLLALEVAKQSEQPEQIYIEHILLNVVNRRCP